MMLFVAMAFVACSDDADEGPAILANPEEKVAGTYVGTWTEIIDGGDPITAEGKTVTIEKDSAYIVDIAVEACLDLVNIPMVRANVCALSDGSFTIANPVSENSWGALFYGKIGNDGSIKFAFKNTKKVGRKEHEYQYSFEGKKQ